MFKTDESDSPVFDLIFAYHRHEISEEAFHAELRDRFNYQQDEIDRMRMWWNINTEIMHQRPLTPDDVIIEVLAGSINIPLYRLMFGDGMIDEIIANRDNLAWVVEKRAKEKERRTKIYEDDLPF